MQKGENIIYADHFILGQIIPAANVPEDIEVYECAENELSVAKQLVNSKNLKNTRFYQYLRR